MIVPSAVTKYVGFEDEVNGDEAAQLTQMVINLSLQDGLRYVESVPFRDGFMIHFVDPRHPVTIPDSVRHELIDAEIRATDERNRDAINDEALAKSNNPDIVKPSRQMIRAIERQQKKQS